ncbi:MAG: hypothetical protein ACLP59_25660 [Bryobacteraceae bacterium]
MRTTRCLLIVAGLLAAIGGQAAAASGPTACPVTKPNGGGATSEPWPAGTYGNAAIAVNVEPDGTVVFQPGGPGFVTLTGALGMKWAWWRGVHGELRIEGRRLDDPAPPLQTYVPSGYKDIGFRPSYLIFPTVGCWEVTGHAGEASVTFVTKVVKIGNGPAWRFDPPLAPDPH